MGIREGIVAIAYEDVEGGESYLARVHQFLKYHLWSGSSAIVTCPSAMSDGAARLLGAHILHGFESAVQGRVFNEACERLASRDVERCWTSGQWMTERVQVVFQRD